MKQCLSVKGRRYLPVTDGLTVAIVVLAKAWLMCITFLSTISHVSLVIVTTNAYDGLVISLYIVQSVSSLQTHEDRSSRLQILSRSSYITFLNFLYVRYPALVMILMSSVSSSSTVVRRWVKICCQVAIVSGQVARVQVAFGVLCLGCVRGAWLLLQARTYFRRQYAVRRNSYVQVRGAVSDSLKRLSCQSCGLSSRYTWL